MRHRQKSKEAGDRVRATQSKYAEALTPLGVYRDKSAAAAKRRAEQASQACVGRGHARSASRDRRAPVLATNGNTTAKGLSSVLKMDSQRRSGSNVQWDGQVSPASGSLGRAHRSGSEHTERQASTSASPSPRLTSPTASTFCRWATAVHYQTPSASPNRSSPVPVYTSGHTSFERRPQQQVVVSAPRVKRACPAGVAPGTFSQPAMEVLKRVATIDGGCSHMRTGTSASASPSPPNAAAVHVANSLKEASFQKQSRRIRPV
ncbi:hypothetical protein DIPPA_07824 [Diplonema papillatum]|nr:hypothetical protein DIPPA_07824 [Diplonema papillatum]